MIKINTTAMVKKASPFLVYAAAFILITFSAKAQTQSKPVQPVLFEGVVTAGYVDQGAFVNCTGPGVKFNKKPFSLLLGLLPSLKIKEDKSNTETKNAIVTPSLGFGLTVSYKHLALQLPCYYLSKTSTKDGRWTAGAGIGYKF